MNTNKVQLMRRDSKTHHVALAASSGRFSDFRSLNAEKKFISWRHWLVCIRRQKVEVKEKYTSEIRKLWLEIVAKQ